MRTIIICNESLVFAERHVDLLVHEINVEYLHLHTTQ